MRVATFVIGVVLAITGETSKAFESVSGSTNGATAAPTERFITPNTNAWLLAQNSQGNALGAMGFVPPSQNPPSFAGARPLSESAERPRQRYNPANIPLPAIRTLEDHLLTGFVALMLIAYQLRRKHRFLRPHQFST